MKQDRSLSDELYDLRNEIARLDERIRKIEKNLESQKRRQNQPLASEISDEEDGFDFKLNENTNNSIEFKVGEYGMAWLGNIVLLFGIAFLIQYLQNSGYKTLSVITGILSISGIYTVCYFTRNTFVHLSKLFAYTAHILLFYFTVRLHFFQTNPIIQSKALALVMLLITFSYMFYLSYKRQSRLMAGMVLLMLLIAGIISDSAHFASSITLIGSILVIAFYYRFGWLWLVFIYIFLGYLSYLNVLLGNPMAGNSPEFIPSLDYAGIYFIGSGFLFSLLALIPQKEDVSDEFLITSIVWNGLGFTTILGLTVFTYLTKSYVPVFISISVFCLIFSILLQSKSKLKIAASMYALYGFLALSVALYGLLLFPWAFMLYAIQSLLVVSMALWFKSRFIVIMNTFLFIFLLIGYITNKTSFNSIDFSFMLVAFVTARVINWKKERLNIKTELIRNVYLIAGFTMTLIAFYRFFPPSYITVSWIGAALLFLFLSRLLKNTKYRWLAIATLIASGIKLIFIDLSDLDIGLRILAFLLLAVISIAVSVIYTRYLVQKKQ